MALTDHHVDGLRLKTGQELPAKTDALKVHVDSPLYLKRLARYHLEKKGNR